MSLAVVWKRKSRTEQVLDERAQGAEVSGGLTPRLPGEVMFEGLRDAPNFADVSNTSAAGQPLELRVHMTAHISLSACFILLQLQALHDCRSLSPQSTSELRHRFDRVLPL